ncbi:AAA family ATPase [Roseibium sediminicola]|uniref:AAA family ATPase n=1 Tax=Roseibium sediminicola TaxID=2933272 RepID=A0ABT0H377_9HYPH|nr:AAA family ATPase [Roseibium sp. CAU 1639]MCK7615930.1 AAA family ATPase [Roseibium sp. CAU 1639]
MSEMRDCGLTEIRECGNKGAPQNSATLPHQTDDRFQSVKIISFVSFKGGAGKTTALMAVTTCLIERGKKVALFEADNNKPISEWRENAVSKNTWHDNCLVFLANNEADFETAYEEASDAGCDFALIDTQGGGSELNNMVLVNSDAIILPTALTVLDTDETLQTFSYAVKVAMAAEIKVPTFVLKTRIPTAKLTQAQKRTGDLLAGLPCLATGLHSRNAFEDMKFKGLLHQAMRQMEENPNDRLIARNYQSAIEEADALTSDILSLVKDKADAA